MANQAPIHVEKVGGIQLSLWENKTSKGTFHSITIDKSYKDGDTWKKTKSLTPTDLVKVQVGITKILEFLYCKEVIKPEKTETPF